MREIKFRSWSKTYGKMIVVDTLGLANDSLSGHWTDGDTDSVNQPGPISKGVLMQYTGLHDRNGKEIFEGDILNASISPPHIGVLEVVKFGSCQFVVEFTLDGDKRIAPLANRIAFGGWEHSDLLKGESK